MRVYKKTDLGDTGFISEKRLGTENTVDQFRVGTSMALPTRKFTVDWENNEKSTPFNLDPNAEYNTLPNEEVDLFLRKLVCIDPDEQSRDEHFSKVSLLVQSMDDDGSTKTTFKDSSVWSHDIQVDIDTQNYINGVQGATDPWVEHSLPVTVNGIRTGGGRVGTSAINFKEQVIDAQRYSYIEKKGFLKINVLNKFIIDEKFCYFCD